MSKQRIVINRLGIFQRTITKGNGAKMCATTQFQFLLMSISIACGCHKPEVKDYIPTEEAARQALSTALDAWKSGKAPDQVGASGPRIEVQDKQWRDGQKLTAYEIIGPAEGDDQNRRFTVRLTIAGAAAPQETIYVVTGKDPVWVFSQESYQGTSGVSSGM